MKLDSSEVQYLKELNASPQWRRIVEKIRDDFEIRPWTPRTEMSEEVKKSRWIYQSGLADGLDRVLKGILYE